MSTSATQVIATELEDRGSRRRSNLSRVNSNTHNSNSNANGQSGLAAVDRGFAAWRLLAAAFVFEALLWGFPLSYGVFQNYYSHLTEFENDPYISLVGTIASGMCYIGAPVVIPWIRRYAVYRRQMILVGWPICIAALVAGSFAKTLASLMLTQGLMYGLGFIIFYYPILSMVDEFWVDRRGMAYGFLCSASGASGTVMPLALQGLLHRYGYPTTLRAIAVALCLATGPLLPLFKSRLPEPEQRNVAHVEVTFKFLGKPLFWIYSASNVVQGLGYFFPSLYLPSYATAIGLSSVQGAVLLTVMSIAQVLGQFSFGYMSDRKVSLNALIAVSLLVSSTATFTLWGFGRSLGPLVVFAMLFGYFAAGYTAMWARMVSAVSTEQSAHLTMFSFFCLGKGIGNVLAGPISARLLQPTVSTESYGAHRFSGIILFTGAAMLLSAAMISPWYVRRLCGRVV